MKKLKKFFLKIWSIETHIAVHIKFIRFLCTNIPILGKLIGMFLDRLLLIIYGIDLTSSSINVKHLSISHPVGVLLGGNGIVSTGRVVIVSGAKFIGRNPNDPEYLRLHKEKSVFVLGDNVFIGAGAIIIGPVEICSNVIIGAMSLVNRSITEPGVYVGSPAKKISDKVTDEWVGHI